MPSVKTLNIRSGRPKSVTMLKTPKKSTRTVITSAERVMALLHSARAKRRMAEIRVPAWLIPMKKTKLVM